MFQAAPKDAVKRRHMAVVFIAALMLALLCAGTAPALAGDDFTASATTAQIAQLNTRMEMIFRDIPQPGMKVNPTLVDKVYEGGRLPVIVRLREGSMPYGFFADKATIR